MTKTPPRHINLVERRISAQLKQSRLKSKPNLQLPVGGAGIGGRKRTQASGCFVTGTYNLLRLARLEQASA